MFFNFYVSKFGCININTFIDIHNITGHLKACISTAAFSATVASTQRESCCEAKGGFTVGFLEKTVSVWWSKYVLLVT